MSTNLPDRRVDRAAIERIIRRATELQTGERDLSDGMTVDEVVSLGKDVGIPQRYLQQAILEEQARTGIEEARGWLDGAVGEGSVMAERVVRGEAEQVERLLLEWISEQELLVVQRQQPGRITWEPMTGMQAALRRSSAAIHGRRLFMLGRASLVSATISQLEPGYTHVALAADVRGTRAGFLGGAAALTMVGGLGSAALAVMTPFAVVAAAPLPLALIGSWVILRQYRPVPQRTRLGLERALDHLEHGPAKAAQAPSKPGSVMDMILTEVRKALKP